MIIMGAGICQWFHGDATYRAILSLLVLTGCMGRNGGGWAHYVGQEKCRPITDGSLWPTPRLDAATADHDRHSYWYMHTDQWRNDGYSTDSLASPLAKDTWPACTPPTRSRSPPASAGCPSTRSSRRTRFRSPTTRRPPSTRVRRARPHTWPVPCRTAASVCHRGRRRPENWPRTWSCGARTSWASAKGNEYFLKHLLGTSNVMGSENPEAPRPAEVSWREEAPEGKLDLLMSADFRMTSTTLLSDVVLPAATWYEKHDLSSTDMHPFVHAFTPAIDPPWEAKSDFELFHVLAQRSRPWPGRISAFARISSASRSHDTGETAQPGGRCSTGAGPDTPARRGGRWSSRSSSATTTIADKLATVGLLADSLGFTVKNVTYRVVRRSRTVKNGVMLGGAGDGRPAIDTDEKPAEAILRFSGTTNGRLAVQGFRTWRNGSGRARGPGRGSEEKRVTFADTQVAPVR